MDGVIFGTVAMAEPDFARDVRPSPEALLAAVAREQRGKLKIFLGAAPGVGKTYEMLQTARRRKAEGVDVVIGVVETHGRKETEALLEGLEVVPRRRVTYPGHTLSEMDIDAILARRPALVLVDELAHTNAPGSRHPKRYLDVEELLAAGIDVYTTVNIQHLESLNDIVAQITRVRVRETVPDRIVDAAEVEVIDLTPDDLMQRLREGKIYIADQAERALKHYFSPGNLTALRELALRRAAERVDEQMVSYMQEHAIAGPWPAGERLLVCISEQPGATQLVRYGKRVADRLRGPWTALYVETPRHQRLGETERDRVAEALRLAEKLGADTLTIPGHRIADDVLAYARENNATQIIIGKSTRSRWFEMLHGSVVHDLLRKAGDISVHVIAGTGEAAPTKPVKTSTGMESIDLAAYAISTGFVAAALGIALLISQFVDLDNISLVFLAAVLASAVRYGAGPSVVAALLSVACYNFFFLPPLYTFTIADPANVVALFFFMIAPPNGAERALQDLPLAALRLSEETQVLLRRLGFRRIGDVIRQPRAPLAARFGAHFHNRLDQTLGRAPEPLSPLAPPPVYRAQASFVEAITTQAHVVEAATHLLSNLAEDFTRDGVGARKLRLLLFRMDGELLSLTIGLAAPSRDARHIASLIALRLDRLPSGLEADFGFEAAGLHVLAAERMPERQALLAVADEIGDPTGLSRLIDRLEQRLGAGAVRRIHPRQSHIPERAVLLRHATDGPPAECAIDVPCNTRPLLLLPRPEAAEVMMAASSHVSSRANSCKVRSVCSIRPFSVY